MTNEDVLNVLKNERYEDAYKYFLEHYNKTKSLIDKYYITIIEFHHMDVSSEKLYSDFKQLLKLPPKYLNGILSPLVFVCAELNKNKEVIKYCKIAINKGEENPFFRVALAKALLLEKGNKKEILMLVENVLIDENINFELIAVCLEIKVNIYLIENKNEEALKSVNQMYLKYGKKDFIDYIKIKILEKKNNCDEEILEMYENLLKGENKNTAIGNIFDFHYKRNNFSKTIEYADIVLKEKLTSGARNMALARKGMSLQALKKYDEAYACFVEMDDEEKFLHLGELHYDMGYKEGILKAIDYFNKYLINNTGTLVVGYLIECYNELGNLDKYYEYISLIKKMDKNYMYINYWLIDYNRRKGLFDKAYKYIKKSFREKTISVYQYHYYASMVAKNPKEHNEFLIKINHGMEENAYFARRCASMLMHGEYGVAINKEEALKKAKLAIELDNCSCSKSVMANYYLNEYETYSKEGYEDYINKKDACPCIVGFYAYKLFVNNEKERAYQILEKLVQENGIKVSENIANLYAYVSLDLHKDINNAYYFLKGFKERRYQVSSTYILIMLEEALNINTTKTKEQMKECLLHCSRAEFEYYNNNPTLPFMNNF